MAGPRLAGAVHDTRSDVVPSASSAGLAGRPGGSATSVTFTVTPTEASTDASTPPRASFPSDACTVTSYPADASWSRAAPGASASRPVDSATANRPDASVSE